MNSNETPPTGNPETGVLEVQVLSRAPLKSAGEIVIRVRFELNQLHTLNNNPACHPPHRL